MSSDIACLGTHGSAYFRISAYSLVKGKMIMRWKFGKIWKKRLYRLWFPPPFLNKFVGTGNNKLSLRSMLKNVSISVHRPVACRIGFYSALKKNIQTNMVKKHCMIHSKSSYNWTKYSVLTLNKRNKENQNYTKIKTLDKTETSELMKDIWMGSCSNISFHIQESWF